MTRFLAASLLLGSGCTLSVISGYEDGGTGSSSTGAAITNGGTTGPLATAGSGTASGGRGSTGQSQGSTGPGLGSGNSSGGSTTGSTRGSSGTTTGYSGDAGPCKNFGDGCVSDAQCCDGACNATCGQAFGQSCLQDPDCSSRNCVNQQCACSQSEGANFSSCATDQDCCGGLGCTHYVEESTQFGLCCTATGASCQGGNECCNQNCVQDQCQCLPEGSDCSEPLDDCCSGICVNVSAPPGALYVCQNPPGGQCSRPSDCTTRDCDGGFCAGCALAAGPCSDASDCCTGLTCASSLHVGGGADAGEAIDGGTACCGQPGTSCDASDGPGPDFGCCGTCTNGSCACVTATNECTSDQSCCAGGACMARVRGGSTDLVCCQVSGQFCLSDDECCSQGCGKDQKCA